MHADIEKLKNELGNSPIVVEGIKDKTPLIKLGFENIFPISGKPLSAVIESIPADHKSVLILTDYDKEGEKIAKILMKFFTAAGVHTLNHLRRKFRAIFKVAKIEEINSMLTKTPEIAESFKTTFV